MPLALIALPSVAQTHVNIPADLVQAYGLGSTILANAIIDAQTVAEAECVVASLKAQSRMHPEFTDDVIQTAKDRAHMLAMLHSGATFGVDITVAQVADRIDRAVERLERRFDSLEARFDRMEARFENVTITKMNRQHLDNNTGTTVYGARQKQVTGDGLPMAQALAVNAVVPPPNPNARVGSVYSPTIDVINLTHAQILGLVRFYNEDFGIHLGDVIGVRRQKIINWLTLPMF